MGGEDVAQQTLASNSGNEGRLPKIGPAPDFTLTNQDGKPFSLRDARGKVAVVTFIFTSCSDTCPLLTSQRESSMRVGSAAARRAGSFWRTSSSERAERSRLRR